MFKKLLVHAALVLTGLTLAFPAAAHYIWIEQDKSHHARLYFGEYQEQERETSPGRLDEIKGPRVWILDAAGNRNEIKVVRKETHFDLGVISDHKSPIIAEELAYEVKNWTKQGIGIVKPMFYTRFSPLAEHTAHKLELMLDIVPENGSPNAFTVYFQNAPLAKAKVMVYAPNFWMQEYTADENGKINIKTPWPGQYVLEVIHLERQPGEFQGNKFEALRHRATLTFDIPAGSHENKASNEK
ncbi:Uncharacterized conserved protein, contains GH25 family domain [Nitrosospira sp. Nsp11]|uniref:DUF4198 domain-containing protein n=1 Tax=Nitrosospira sp. Nsp11 TaxID=1855338 RepID=UPI00091E9F6D|nr:DUF4198 domain-containing protein [Nitrosospira sp. Nsp11]SHL63295.1 Uncharacterized conserved protein, contains GH25 family domain [Nitrosospira sp. Nsp11]